MIQYLINKPLFTSTKVGHFCSWSPGLHTSKEGLWPIPLCRNLHMSLGYLVASWQLKASTSSAASFSPLLCCHDSVFLVIVMLEDSSMVNCKWPVFI